MTTRLWRAPWDVLATAAVCVGWGVTQGHDRFLNIDHRTYLATVHLMRAGHGYYSSMNRALRSLIGPAATPRAFRMPTVFWLWKLLPNDRAIWVLLVVLVGVASIALGRLVRAPWAAPLVATYLLYNAWNKFTLVEIWAVVIVVAAVVAWARGYRAASVVLAVVAALVRETTVVLLLGGLLWAWRHRERRWPWVAGLVVCAVAFALSSAAVSPYLAKHGTESPLLGTGRPPFSVFRWMGFGLPLGPALGPVLWVIAVLALLGEIPPRRSGRARDDPWPPIRGIDDMLLPYLALPILGFLVQRDYWGVLIVPFTMALTAGVIQLRVGALRAGAPGRPP